MNLTNLKDELSTSSYKMTISIGVAPIGPVGPGLHFISENEKNKTSKFAIKLKGGGVVGVGTRPKTIHLFVDK